VLRLTVALLQYRPAICPDRFPRPTVGRRTPRARSGEHFHKLIKASPVQPQVFGRKLGTGDVNVQRLATITGTPAIAMTVAAFHPNMTGDEAIKVVELTLGGSLLWKRQPT
jgi:hypothetical protein